ncbi:MAG: hypothetical protein QOH43_567 [Solirubrobacteraceae bacterium]|nr:hypothetical protein [Solirubrobacteraceae bacterium]
MATGEPPSVASQVVRRSPSSASQAVVRSSKSGSAAVPALHSDRNDAIAAASPAPATRTSTSRTSVAIATVVADTMSSPRRIRLSVIDTTRSD